MSNMDIAIIGGGITGLSTAIAFNKVGINAKVFECTQELSEVGAGIWMAPNAMKVFDWLGISKEIIAGGIQLKRVEITNKNLIPLRNSKTDFITDTQGNSITSIHRANLQWILYNELPKEQVIFGKEYINHEEKDNKVNIKFNNGEETVSIMFGADGINSKVRNHIFPDSQIRFAGQTCWRGVSNIKLSTEYQSSCMEAWGNQIRFGFSAIAKDEVYWFAVIKSSRGQTGGGDTLKDRLLNIYKDFHPQVHEIISNTQVEKIICTDLSDVKPMNVWHKGRICLLGDAAHATTPNTGQGGAQGVEDAYYISNLMNKTMDYKKCFQNFEKLRKKKVNNIVKYSWMFGKLIHNEISQNLLKLMNRLTPDKLIMKQMQQLYSIKPKESFNENCI